MVELNCGESKLTNRRMSMKSVTTPEAGDQLSVDILDDGNLIKLYWPGAQPCRFHAVWLRDNGHDTKTRDPGNWQKLITVSDIPEQTRVERASIDAHGRLELTFQPDLWQTSIDTDWLWEHRYDRERVETTLFQPHVTTWSGSFSDALARVSFADVATLPQALLQWLCAIDEFGVGVMEGIAIRSESVLDVIGLFGFPRRTNYGTWFEIKAVDNPANLASSALGLQAHTDNPYRDPVPTLQLFAWHCQTKVD